MNINHISLVFAAAALLACCADLELSHVGAVETKAFDLLLMRLPYRSKLLTVGHIKKAQRCTLSFKFCGEGGIAT